MVTLQNIVHSLILGGGSTEHYGGTIVNGNMNSSMMASFFVTYLLIYILLLLIGKFLWNTYLVDMFSVVRPISSVWHLVAFSILAKLVIY
jgi:hypothetical protein